MQNPHSSPTGQEKITLIKNETAASPASAFELPLARRVTAFVFLMVAEFFYSWAWNTIDVLRPYIRDTLRLSLTQVGSAYSAQSAGALAGAFLIGQMADRFGRRNMLVAIMSGYGVFLLAGVFVGSYFELLLQRFLLGIFLGGSFPTVVGIYVGLFAPRLRGRLASAVNATFSSAIITLGFAFGHLAGHNWRLLLWAGALPPIALSVFAFFLIPVTTTIQTNGAKGRLPIAEMFAPAVRLQTLLLASLTGLNFFAYQAFSGWLTIYLTDVRMMPAAVSGRLIATQFFGNIIGGFFWGWAGDRFGRRFNAVGFLIAAASIAIFVALPSDPVLLMIFGSAYGFALPASVVWGPWLAELYPQHLRSTAASIFNWGRLISFFAPLITGALGSAFGLRTTMLVGSATFVVAAAVWRRLPETLSRTTGSAA